jgi:hypothetical protein
LAVEVLQLFLEYALVVAILGEVEEIAQDDRSVFEGSIMHEGA